MSLLHRRLTTCFLSALFCWMLSVTGAQAENRDEVIFFFNDAQGSAVAAVNEAGELCWSEEYTAYGDKGINDDVFSTTGCGIVGEERGFTGHTEDVNSDLVYMQQRYYDPSIGRFLSIDPREANPNEPMTFNRYAYANNNPYKYTDPNGEIPVLIWGLYVGATAALTAYDSYQAYQEGGAGALAKQAAVDVALSVAGAKVASKVAGGVIDGANAFNNALGVVDKFVDAKNLRFTQDSIGSNFSDGRSVHDLIDKLTSGEILPSDLPAIRTFVQNGRTYTLDNRRLYAAQQAGVQVKTIQATAEEIARELPRKFTTVNDGATVRVRKQSQ